MRALRITDWDKNYEKADTRKIKEMKWFSMTNKHDGLGYGLIAEHDNKYKIFTCWVLLLQLASKMPERGTLVGKLGPLTTKHMAIKTKFDQEAFDIAIPFLLEIGWLEEVSAELSG